MAIMLITSFLRDELQMSTVVNAVNNDPYDLARFVSAQNNSFDQAFTEVKNGRKSSHWMWYIFPQLRGLGRSSMSQYYGISGAKEASAYLNHDLLGSRLIAICEALLSVEGRSATDIFGKPDDMKLLSCATLFAYVAGADSIFDKILEKYYDDGVDQRTVQMLQNP